MNYAMQEVIRIKLQIEVGRDGSGYHAFCRALKGLHVCGDTEKEALEAAKDAAAAYILSILKHGEPLPVGVEEPTFFEKVRSLIPSRRQHLVTTEVTCAA